jgi:DNA-binding NtrC family response regulator
VRELENEMRRLVVLASEHVELASLSTAVLEGRTATRGRGPAPVVDGDLRETIANFEQSAIEDAVQSADGNKSQAARALGISRFALQRKLDKYELDGEGSAAPGGRS